MRDLRFRFEKVQQQQEEEYGKLCLQLQLCNEENERLNKMLDNLTKVGDSVATN